MDPFIKLTTKLTNPTVTTEEKLKDICLTTAALIKGADRVSLWCFDADLESINLLICFDKSTGSFSSNQTLKKCDYNDYFSGILENDSINASNARTHELTQCFNESYFIPFEIYSLLDFILHQDFNPHGVICCESVGKTTQWSDDNVETLKRIASSSSMYFFKPDK
jgi:hypothetical protein